MCGPPPACSCDEAKAATAFCLLADGVQYDTLLASHDLAGGGRGGWTQVSAPAKQGTGAEGSCCSEELLAPTPRPCLACAVRLPALMPWRCTALFCVQAELQAVAARLPRCQELSRMAAGGSSEGDGDPGAEYEVEGEAEEEDEYE